MGFPFRDGNKKIGRAIAKKISPSSVVAFYGDLGAGKTTLIKGIARGLGVQSESVVSSPTYVVIHEYKGRAHQTIFHLDWYRLKKVTGVDEALALECFDSAGVS